MLSLNIMIKKIAGLAGTTQVTSWENGFIENIVTRRTSRKGARGYSSESPGDRDVTEKERKELERLHRLWATGKATRAQMLRCMELDRKASHCAQTK
jgi:hypothetical protein